MIGALIGAFVKAISKAVKVVLAVVIVCVLYGFFGGLLLLGEVKAWDGTKGVVGGNAGSAALIFVGAVMVAVAWFGGSRVISYVSLKLTGVDDIKDGGL